MVDNGLVEKRLHSVIGSVANPNGSLDALFVLV